MLVRAVNTAISAGWLILAVVAVRAVCRKVPRAMICLLWALVAVRLVCPFSLKSPLSLIPNAQTIPASAVSAAAPKASEAAEPAGTDAVDDPAYAAPAVHIEAADIRDWRVYGTVLWLAGTAALLACALVSWLRLRRQVSASVRVKGNIFICDWIGSPFILGILRPRIYLPSAMDREQFTYVLAHEHAHLKRRDHWWKPLGFLLLAVYWFHPLVWAAYILFCRDMELACDERVVRDMGIWERKLYSEILLCCSSPGPAASVCPVGFGGVGVKARIKSVLRCRRPAPRTILGMGAVCAVLAVCFLTDPPRSLASNAHVTAEPSPTPIVHHLTGEDIAALNGTEGEQAAPVETPTADLPALILYDGQLYMGADPNRLGSMGPGRTVGQIAGVVARDQIPTHELETNNQALEGATVLYDDWYDHMLFVETPDAPNLYSYFVPYNPERIAALEADKAAVEESEESFAAMLARMESSGREQMTYEEFAAQYGVELISLDNAPEGYENIGYVFVTAPFEADEPGQGFLAEPIITQVLYSWEERTAITVTQNYTGDSDTPPYFVYGDTDEIGRPLSDTFWYSYQADYTGGTTGGKDIGMHMESTHHMLPKECWLIFRALWPEG